MRRRDRSALLPTAVFFPHRALFFPHPSPATDLPRRSPSTDSKTFKKPRRPFEKERLDSELKVVGEYGLRNKRELWRVQFALNKLRNAARVLLTLDEKDPKRIFEGEAIMRRMYRYGLLVRSRFPFDNHFIFWIFGGEHEASASVGPVCRRLSCRGIGLGSGARTLKIAEKKFASLTADATSLSLAQQDESQDKLDYVLALTPEIFLERRLQTLVFKLGLAKSVHHARVLIKQRHIRVGKQIVNIPSFLVRADSQKHIDFSLNSPLGGGRPGRVKRKRMAAAGGGGGDGEEEDE